MSFIFTYVITHTLKKLLLQSLKFQVVLHLKCPETLLELKMGSYISWKIVYFISVKNQ